MGYAGDAPAASKLRAQQALTGALLLLAAVPPVALATTALQSPQPDLPTSATPAAVTAGPLPTPALDAAVAGQAARWAGEQLKPGIAVLTDEDLAQHLRGTQAGRALDLRVVPVGSADAEARFDAGCVQALLVTPKLRAALKTQAASPPASLPALADLPMLASFGRGPEQVSVHEVPAGDAAATRQVRQDDLTGRRRAAARLAANPNLELSESAEEALDGGDVDARLLSVLAQLAARRTLTVAALPQPEGEQGLPTPRHIAHVSALDGRPVGTAASAVDEVTAALRAQPPAYRPTVRVEGRGRQALLVISYDLPSPVGLLSSATIGPSPS